MSIPCKAEIGRMEAAKSFTYLLAIGTQYGIISLKVVEKKLRGDKGVCTIFSGYEPASWDPDPSGLAPALAHDARFWNHHYFKLTRQGAFRSPGTMTIETVFLDLRYYTVIPEHILDLIRDTLSNPYSVHSARWDMLLGHTPGVASAKKRGAMPGSPVPGPPPSTALGDALRASLDAFKEQHRLNDAGWGIF